MRKKLFLGLLATSLVFAMNITAFAGQWKSDYKGRWYDNGDGTYPKNTWQWIVNDSNDEIEECYYFDGNGYLLTNTKTSDGYNVNEDGKWYEDYYYFPIFRKIPISYQDYVKKKETWWRETNPNAKIELTSSSAASSYYDEYMFMSKKADVHEAVVKKCELIEQNPSPEFVKTQLTNVEVPIWKMGKNGEKIPSKTTLTVLAEIKDEVYQVFNEIYNGLEKFPIKDAFAYQWRPNGLHSNHSYGLAIDMNVHENPQMTEAGDRAIVGGAWQPYTNPYSITPDGDVARAFGRHGFTWGARFSRPDYMHFEFNSWQY